MYQSTGLRSERSGTISDEIGMESAELTGHKDLMLIAETLASPL
jgi:hypothetical protein